MTRTVVGPALIFDGDCAFCTSTAHRISSHWDGPERAEAWQRLGADELRDIGLSEEHVRYAAYWVDERGRLFRGHAALGQALLRGRGTDRVLGRLLLVPPLSWLARPGYWIVARHRHRLPGASDHCRL